MAILLPNAPVLLPLKSLIVTSYYMVGFWYPNSVFRYIPGVSGVSGTCWRASRYLILGIRCIRYLLRRDLPHNASVLLPRSLLALTIYHIVGFRYQISGFRYSGVFM